MIGKNLTLWDISPEISVLHFKYLIAEKDEYALRPGSQHTPGSIRLIYAGKVLENKRSL